MVKIYCDGRLIHDPGSPKSVLLSPACSLAVNSAGTLNFQMLPNHPYYNNIRKRKSFIDVYSDGDLIFSGFVSSDSTAFNNVKTVTVQGELAYLNDSIQPYSEYHDMPVRSYLETLIANHNSQVDDFKKFTVGIVTVADNNDSLYRQSHYEKTKAAISDKLVSRLGGYICSRHENGIKYIDYINEYDHINTQGIEFGKNLIDFLRTNSTDTVANVIIPLGAKLKDAEGKDTEERLTIESVNHGKNYLEDTESIAEYGRIVDTVIYDDVTLPSNLIQRGQADLASRKYLNSTIKITAVDLHSLGMNVPEIKVGDLIPVKSPVHGVDDYITVSEIKIDLMNPGSSVYSMNKTVATLTDSKLHADKVINEIKADYVTNQQLNNTVSEKISKAVKSILVEYCLSDSFTEVTGGEWSASSPAWTVGKYIWQRTKTIYIDNTYSLSEPVCISGAQGQPGIDGKGITEVSAEYALSDSKNEVPIEWSADPPVWAPEHYLWSRSKITYTDGSIEYTTPYCDSSWEAVNIVQQAVEKNTAEIKQLPGQILAEVSREYSKVSSVDYIQNLINGSALKWSGEGPPTVGANTGMWYAIPKILPFFLRTWGSWPKGETNQDHIGDIYTDTLTGKKYVFRANEAGEFLWEYLEENAYLYDLSRLNMKSDSIKLSVDKISSDIGVQGAELSILSDRISSKVSKGGVVSEINQTSDRITLSGNRIVINSTYFSVSADGHITATGGTIGGFSISAEYLANNTDRINYLGEGGVTPDGTPDQCVYVGTDGISLGRNAKIKNNGVAYFQEMISTGHFDGVSGVTNGHAGMITTKINKSSIFIDFTADNPSNPNSSGGIFYQDRSYSSARAVGLAFKGNWGQFGTLIAEDNFYFRGKYYQPDSNGYLRSL